MEPKSVQQLPVLRTVCARNLLRLGQVARAVILSSFAFVLTQNVASAQAATSNGGDPLFCQPDEGATFLIINGGSGLFTVNTDCYNDNIGTPPSNTPPGPTIATTQGGTLTLNITDQGGNYTYTPPTPTFVGLDTFTIQVTTTWNAEGGPGSAGGTLLSRPGGVDNVVVTLNVLPSTFNLQASGATSVPIPTGFVTGCGAQGNPGEGPAPSVIVGCVKALGLAPFNETSHITTAHGSVTTVGSGAGETLRYTPTTGYTGTDSFNFHIFGTNTDGATALDSGNGSIPTNTANALMQVTVNPALVITNASPLPNGAQGSAYTAQTLSATGGFPGTSPAYTFTVSAGTLPPGMTLTNGVLSGTPTTTGVFNFTIQAADDAVFTNPTTGDPSATSSAPNTVTKAFQLTVGTAVSTSSLPAPTLGFWGMLLLCGSLLLFGARAVARRQA